MLCLSHFEMPKTTLHLQQEVIRKSNEANSSALLEQRYIKLPVKSINRLSESTDNNHKILIHINNTSNHLNDKLKSTTESNPHILYKSGSVGPPPPLPKPPHCKSLGLSPKCCSLLFKHSSKPSSKPLPKPLPTPSPKLSPKPPPRPLTSHPGLSCSSASIMPRHKVQFSSINTSDTLSSPLNEDNVCNVSSNPTRETSLTASALNASNSASSVERNGSQSVQNTTPVPPLPSTSSTSGSCGADWNKSGAFISKPARGWLHPDQQIADTGIAYAVRYVGCLGINTSMKSLDFDTRSQIAKECINRVCELGRLKTPDKKRRPEKRITRMLADNPNMECAGADVNLVITSGYLHLTVIETGENIARHEMPNISFASGGDADTLDFVAYVAKDHRYGRACFVLECGGGLAQDVITTIGQAFELRFKEFLKRSPKSLSVNERLESSVANGSNSLNATNNLNQDTDTKNLPEDRDYYNDLPGKMPPEVPKGDAPDMAPAKEGSTIQRVAQTVPQAAPRTGLKKTSEQNSPNLIDLNIDIQEQNTGNSTQTTSTAQTESDCQQNERSEHQYVNCAAEASNDNQNKAEPLSESSTQLTPKDPFDMKPFNSALAEVLDTPANSAERVASHSKSSVISELEGEDWFHGPISRKDSETLVVKDGDFLVRESQGSAGQYVLTGMQSGIRKHLLLVDPEGVVRTKDKTFESVSHLINYHRNNGLPIISAESALVLRNAVFVKR
ncbi:unnamed protein product [Medioppia subpectinata]|uniref:SHC-transforming protein 1 n=1 Tax=Medioppia subpectinata TaxID=1979941 RepID=A0A7R9PZ68_9ACAR|nr:unnamed protein product [Medioppia subpectinata]CAG2105897.1 unnamed protein product [Medioppia subpectinata]